METYFMYLLKASACLTIFYLGFLILFRNSAAFGQQRLFLLLSVFLAFALPLNQFSLRTMSTTPEVHRSFQAQTPNVPELNNNLVQNQHGLIQPAEIKNLSLATLDPWRYAYLLYFSITSLLLLRILLGIIRFLIIMTKSGSINIHGRKLYLSAKVPGSTSFLQLLFLNPGLKDHPELSKIISHENIHASQYHTLDVLLVELLAAAMWFNPVVWFLRRSLQQLHEYLADEGVINSGHDRLEYQKLLVNHIAEETLLLSSGFQSSIKKRIIMMTKHKTTRGTEKKFLALLPIAAGILVAISCMNSPKAVETSSKDSLDKVTAEKSTYAIKNDSTDKVIAEKLALEKTGKEEYVGAIALTKMNVLYLGVDNPVDIAVSGVSVDKIRPFITNGTIFKTVNGYIIRPKAVGTVIVGIEAMLNDEWEVVRTMEYRVKRVPDPAVYIAGQKGGDISKEKLLKATKLDVWMENFDFEMHFRITNFTLSAAIEGNAYDEISKSDLLTPAQLNLIKDLKKGQKVYFTDINAVGPDGVERKLSPVQFTMIE